MSQPEEGPPEFSFTPKPSSGASVSYARNRKLRRSPMVMLAPLILLGVVGAGGLAMYVLSKNRAPSAGKLSLSPIADQEVVELKTFVVDAVAQVPPEDQENLVYWLAEAPEGAVIDAATGRITWQPTEAQGPGNYNVAVGATLANDKDAEARVQFAIEVMEEPSPPKVESVGEQGARPGEPMSVEITAADPDVPGNPVRFCLAPGAPEGATIDPNTGRFQWTPSKQDGGKTHKILIDVTEAVENGQSTQFTLHVTVAAPPKPQTDPLPAMVEEEKPKVETPVEVAEAPLSDGDKTILELFEKRKLFHPSSYPTLRKIFADRFAEAHADEIKAAWEDDYEDLTAWLDEQVDIKEELYRAIDPEVDNVPAALGLFREIWKLSPRDLARYGNLAIAVAVTWDQPDRVYDYAGHQQRVRATMPEGLLGAIDNYKYVIQEANVMQGRGQFLPWEFLVHIINHKTPLMEREWAIKRFLPERAMFGKCYSKVPYDGEMLSTGGAVCKMEGKEYTLPNLLAFGGVCAHQADFASRVGKSLGVPAAYVGGENRYGGNHAWVMWVELKDVNRKGILFSLESHGRYRGDHYYVGHLRDPRTGNRITDRQLELYLHTVGANPIAKRQADMIMAAYPMLRDTNEMDLGDQLAFFDQLLGICPWHEPAWRAVAAMSRDGHIPKTHTKMMDGIVNRMFVTFAAFPDFTWEIFDDLIAYHEMPKTKDALYRNLMLLYEQAKRPDLSCEARLRYSDYLVENDMSKAAINGLAASILLFADEGRFVPKMLDRMEALCAEHMELGPEVLNFYRQFLPRIPVARGSRPSAYCIEMYERAIKQFRAQGQEPTAQQLETYLAQLKESSG